MNISSLNKTTFDKFAQNTEKEYLPNILVDELKTLCNYTSDNNNYTICNDKNFYNRLNGRYISGTIFTDKNNETIHCFEIYIDDAGKYQIGKKKKLSEYLAYYHDTNSMMYEKLLEMYDEYTNVY